jgi:hypothetical protein
VEQGFCIIFFSKGCNRKVTPVVPTETVDTVAKKMDAAVNETQNALGIFFRFKLPNGIELNVPGIWNRKQIEYMVDGQNESRGQNNLFNFDRLLFDTGKQLCDRNHRTTEKIWPKF